jgi:hypothetical protein
LVKLRRIIKETVMKLLFFIILIQVCVLNQPSTANVTVSVLQQLVMFYIVFLRMIGITLMGFVIFLDSFNRFFGVL